MQESMFVTKQFHSYRVILKQFYDHAKNSGASLLVSFDAALSSDAFSKNLKII
jgi:hypothetical protein